MDINKFSYHLPSRYIAQKPLAKRDNARLMVLDRKTKKIKHDRFFNLGQYLRPGDCLVLNESKVQKCRLLGTKDKTGAKIECFVLENINGNKYLVLLKPSKRLKEGTKVWVGEHWFKVLEKKERGKALVEFDIDAPQLFKECGLVPLPPYIKNTLIEEDRYQTVYARVEGSTAAPTAGLHFTTGLINKLKQNDVSFAYVGLDIGIDTFRPITEERIEDHQIHSEKYYLNKEQAAIINNAKKRGGRIVAVGTTTTRVLETVRGKYERITEDSGYTSLYIYPGYEFKAIDALITNFHLPRSSLLVMVSAFAGTDYILSSYREAVNKGYRFFSFGDCMLIN